MKKILVATAGDFAAQARAEYVVSIAEALNVTLVALHISRDHEPDESHGDGLGVFVRAAELADVPIEKEIRHGEVVKNIIECAEDHDAAMIIMGASEGRILSEWLSADVFDQTTIPVVVLPHQWNST